MCEESCISLRPRYMQNLDMTLEKKMWGPWRQDSFKMLSLSKNEPSPFDHEHSDEGHHPDHFAVDIITKRPDGRKHEIKDRIYGSQGDQSRALPSSPPDTINTTPSSPHDQPIYLSKVGESVHSRGKSNDARSCEEMCPLRNGALWDPMPLSQRCSGDLELVHAVMECFCEQVSLDLCSFHLSPCRISKSPSSPAHSLCTCIMYCGLSFFRRGKLACARWKHPCARWMRSSFFLTRYVF